MDSGLWTVERDKAKGERRKGNKWTVDSGQLKGRDLNWDLQDFVTMILICSRQPKPWCIALRD